MHLTNVFRTISGYFKNPPLNSKGLLIILSLIAASDNYAEVLVFSSSTSLAREFNLSDAAVGALPFAETVAYALLALWIACLADRYPRRRIILFGVFSWSVLTGLCGLAAGYGTFLALRFLIGGADACFDAPAASLLTDAHHPRAWARVLGVLNAADLAGILLGLLVQGLVVQVYGWRSAFLWTAGLSLVVFFLAVLVLGEPGRGTNAGKISGPAVPPFKEAAWAAWTGLRTGFRPVFASPAQLISIVGRIVNFCSFIGLGYFFPLLLNRYFGLRAAAAAPLYGVVVVTSVAGSLVGGWLNGVLERQYGPARHFVLAGFSLSAMGASYLVGLLIGTLPSVVAGALGMGFCMGASYPSLAALVGEIQPPERRAYGFASQVAPAFLVGGFAPLAIGALSDALGSLRAATAFFTACIGLVGVFVLISYRLVKPPCP